jgi:PhoD-like phosphatase
VAELLLGPMLRHVTATSATIWVETDEACIVEILGRSIPTFCVAAHHYALLIIEDLEPATSTEYEVKLDHQRRWPAEGSVLPASRIRTLGHGGPTRIIFGSCRTAAPHEPPWTLELSLDRRGRGVDALYAYALRMIEQPPDEWPDLAVFLGDQIYADDSSPFTRARVAATREPTTNDDASSLPADLVDGFDEFTWVYQESWSPPVERWFFANVPTAMVFDDHEMIDDWNISDAWVREIRSHDWWENHVIGGLMTYWLYQHLGNLSPDVIRTEGILDDLYRIGDGWQRLRDWALESEEFTGARDRYRFNFYRDLEGVRLVMIDARNGRVLTPGRRRIVDDNEWRWIVAACDADVDHLLIGSSVPVFVPGGLHDLQVWDEAIADGAWGSIGRRVGEWIRVKCDMEDWPSFSHSFDAFVDLLHDLGCASRPEAPSTISVLSGDIHLSYVAEVVFPHDEPVASRVHQLVSSPMRNVLTGPDRNAMRLGASRVARILARVLLRCVRRHPAAVAWKIDDGPIFENSVSLLSFKGRAADLRILQTRPSDDSTVELFSTIDIDLTRGSRSALEFDAAAS